jgi:uncharacterized protein
MAYPVALFMPPHSLPKRVLHWTGAILVFACLGLALDISTPAGQVQSPQQVAAQAKTTGYVTDLAGVLSPAGRERIEALCTELSQKADAEIAVVTVKTISDTPVETYALDLFEGIGIGPKRQGRGVLILFATDDHKDRIQTGYGLEPILPDAKDGDFLREAVPDLRANNYDGAIYLVTRRVADVIASDKGVTLSGASPQRSGRESSPHIPPFVIFLVIFIIYSIIHGIVVASRGGPRGLGPRGGGGGWVVPFILGNMVGRSGWGGGGFGGGGGGGFGGFGGGGFGGGFGSGGGGASGGW